MYKEISVKTEASQSILIENLPKETFSIPSDILNISNRLVATPLI